MRLTNVVSGYTIGVLLLVVFSALLAFWHIERTRFHIDRMELAQSSYEAHLRLSNHSYQLFKQFGDALIIGDRDRGTGERELTTLIREDIATIRGIIATEIELVGEEEIEELEVLETLEAKIEGLIFKYNVLTPQTTEAPGNLASKWSEFTQLLDDDVDQAFRSLMEEALEEEQEEVAETKQLLADDMRVAQILGVAFLVVASGFTLAALAYYRRYVSHPLAKLMTGVKRMEDGEFDKRFESTGSTEINQVGALLNSMAQKVHARQRGLESENSELEATVKDRNSELERLLEEAQVNASARHQLLADVSHELRTPLTIIQGESEIALRSKNTSQDELREALRRAKTAAEHTAALVDDLLLISRQESGNLKLKTEPADLVSLVNDAVSLSPLLAEVKTGDEKIPVHIDKLRIRQSLLALLQNSRMYGANSVIVNVGTTGEESHIIIDDDGPGMSEEDKKRAFSRFFRGSNASKSYDSGHGLGLPIVKSVIQSHGGTVELTDSPQGGLQVKLTLPMRAALRSVS